MKGWRARLGFLIPPGNPTVEPELIAMTPPGVSVHFSRLVARGPAGTHQGQEQRNRSQIEHIDESAALLAMVKPNVIILAHTATSYTLGRSAEAAHLRRLQAQYTVPFATAFGSVAAALHELAVKRVALGTPYSEEITLKGKAHLEEHGFEVVSHRRLENVTAQVEAGGGTLSNIVKLTTFHVDIRHRAELASIREEFFGKQAPASTLVGVTALAQPGWLIEVEAIAVI
jgi:maleate isomerase